MSSRFSFVAVEERSPLAAADAIGAGLAASRAWIPLFIGFLDGLTFRTLPSFTHGATAFEAATRHDERARNIISLLDDVYREVRDGYDVRHAEGEILERLVWHLLAERFAAPLGPCCVTRDGARDNDYALDAATEEGPPAVGVEAKTSLRALIGPPARRHRHAAKAAWVTSLREDTADQLAAAFATWKVESRFRAKLAALIGDDEANEAFVIAHEQLGQLAGRLAAIRQRLAAPA